MDDRRDLYRAAAALSPYLDQLVFVGGWAHQLLLEHPLASPLAFSPLRTQDADVVAPSRLAPRQETLGKLLEDAGFQEHLMGDDRPPVAEYALAGAGSALTLEFLCPLLGPDVDREGRPRSTQELLGVSAQTLRHLELLLFEPWTILLEPAPDAGTGRGIEIRIANPVSFLAQKVLVLKKRTQPAKRAKDVLYMRDTILAFGEQSTELAALWRRMKTSLPERTQRSFEQEWQKLAASVDDVHRQAMQISLQAGRGEQGSAEELRQVLAVGFARIFG